MCSRRGRSHMGGCGCGGHTCANMLRQPKVRTTACRMRSTTSINALRRSAQSLAFGDRVLIQSTWCACPDFFKIIVTPGTFCDTMLHFGFSAQPGTTLFAKQYRSVECQVGRTAFAVDVRTGANVVLTEKPPFIFFLPLFTPNTPIEFSP